MKKFIHINFEMDIYIIFFDVNMIAKAVWFILNIQNTSPQFNDCSQMDKKQALIL